MKQILTGYDFFDEQGFDNDFISYSQQTKLGTRIGKVHDSEKEVLDTLETNPNKAADIHVLGVSIGNDEKKISTFSSLGESAISFFHHPDNPVEDKLYCEEYPYTEEAE